MNMNGNDFDEMIRRLMRIMGMDSPFPNTHPRPSRIRRNPIDEGDMYFGDDVIAITIDLSKYAKKEDIKVKAIDNKHILIEVINYDDIANVFTRELELPKCIIEDSVKTTYKNGILDIVIDIDKRREKVI